MRTENSNQQILDKRKLCLFFVVTTALVVVAIFLSLFSIERRVKQVISRMGLHQVPGTFLAMPYDSPEDVFEVLWRCLFDSNEEISNSSGDYFCLLIVGSTSLAGQLNISEVEWDYQMRTFIDKKKKQYPSLDTREGYAASVLWEEYQKYREGSIPMDKKTNKPAGKP